MSAPTAGHDKCPSLKPPAKESKIARRAILAGRRTEHQAAVFVMKAMPRYEFRCGRDRFHVIMNWLADAA
jgi:hypothetical protein